jgi:hypothetical protein
MRNVTSLLRLPYRLIRATLSLPTFAVELFRQRQNPNYINSAQSYFLMRTLYVISGGYLNELLNWFVFRKKLPKTWLMSGIKTLPRQDVRVLHEITEMPCFILGKPERTGPISDFRSVDVGAVQICEKDLFASAGIAEFVTRERWLDEARQVIGIDPIVVGVHGWWSKPCTKHQLSDAAQMWHRDLDRLRDVKIFFYVTDVNEENEPFEYVTGSHLPSFAAFSRSDGRLADSWVQKRYPNRAISMKGPAGTAFLADTHGIHRGCPVQRGMRCALQLYYTSFLFGAEFQYQPRIPLNPNWPSFPLWKAAIDRSRRTWAPLFDPSSIAK